MKRLINWIKNLRHLHERMMMEYLEKRGWVVFYLEPEQRQCGAKICWLKLYNEERKNECEK